MHEETYQCGPYPGSWQSIIVVLSVCLLYSYGVYNGVALALWLRGEDFGVGTMVSMVNGSTMNVLTGISNVYTRCGTGMARMARDILRSMFTVMVLISVAGLAVPLSRLDSAVDRVNGRVKLSVCMVRRSVFGAVRRVWFYLMGRWQVVGGYNITIPQVFVRTPGDGLKRASSVQLFTQGSVAS